MWYWLFALPFPSKRGYIAMLTTEKKQGMHGHDHFPFHLFRMRTGICGHWESPFPFSEEVSNMWPWSLTPPFLNYNCKMAAAAILQAIILSFASYHSERLPMNIGNIMCETERSVEAKRLRSKKCWPSLGLALFFALQRFKKCYLTGHRPLCILIDDICTRRLQHRISIMIWNTRRTVFEMKFDIASG